MHLVLLVKLFVLEEQRLQEYEALLVMEHPMVGKLYQISALIAGRVQLQVGAGVVSALGLPAAAVAMSSAVE